MKRLLKFGAYGFAGLIALVAAVAVLSGGSDEGTDTAAGDVATVGDVAGVVTPPQEASEAASPSDEGSEAASDAAPATTEAEEQEEQPPSQTESATVAQPQPRDLKGTGKQVKEVALRADAPLIVTGYHGGTSNFIVHLVPTTAGGTEHYLFNEIGRYRGQTAVASPEPGKYRVQIDADGEWTLRFVQPYPGDLEATTLPGTIEGRGARVVRVEVAEDMNPVVAATHRGESNFIVHLIAYGDTGADSLFFMSEQFVFNEIGNFNGEALAKMPKGNYLVYVEADGAWTLNFKR